MLSIVRLTPRDDGDQRPDGLHALVPAFPAGPAMPPGGQLPAAPPFVEPADLLPAGCPWALLQGLAADEARFRRATTEWRERMWFLVGRVSRDPSGMLYASIERAVEAPGLVSTAAAFSCGPLDYSRVVDGLDPGERVMGMCHTHDLGRITDLRPAAGEGGATALAVSSLFLSAQDIETALSVFAAPWHFSIVLASDSLAGDDWEERLRTAAGMGRAFAVFGYFDGVLVRRSITLTGASQL